MLNICIYRYLKKSRTICEISKRNLLLAAARDRDASIPTLYRRKQASDVMRSGIHIPSP